MPTFAERLRELREQAGLTQAQMAEASGLPLGSIRNYEQGQREPYWAVVFKLAAALGASADAFAVCVDESSLVPMTAKGSRPAKQQAATASEPPTKERSRKPKKKT
jgi:transcriptional regulator with XRE-family HTH domain